MIAATDHGHWVRVMNGAQKGKVGVADAFNFYAGIEQARVINPHTRENLGWFHLSDLMLTTPPAVESSSDIAPLLDLVMGRRA